MNEVIKRIKNRSFSGDEVRWIINQLINDGPIRSSYLETLGYVQLYCPELLKDELMRLFIVLGLFYKVKNTTIAEAQSLEEIVFLNYRDATRDELNEDFTPIQVDIISSINSTQYFSFSAPTSTGKSYIFLNLIRNSTKDIVIVVPSRALINEYYMRLNASLTDKNVNILTHIDDVNTAHAQRTVFIVTPERCREIFKKASCYEVEMFLYDEAQLSEDEGSRGIYYDGIVRRILKAFPSSKCVFAHPFVCNPDAQLRKNNFDLDKSKSFSYKELSVAQLYYCHEKYESFYHFGPDKEIMGNRKIPCSDPIEDTIKNNGSVLFYVSKACITQKKYLTKFERYVKLCDVYEDDAVKMYIERVEQYTGAKSRERGENFYSAFVALMRRGIVVHHGSLPLNVRMIIEQYTQSGLCRICFATSTLEQGVNMPFDVVVLDRFEKSKALSVRNMMGRAGRASSNQKLDIGSIIVKCDNVRDLRVILRDEISLQDKSRLDIEEDDDDHAEYKDAIKNGTMLDEYNLTAKEVERLEGDRIVGVIKEILDFTLHNDERLSETEFNSDEKGRYKLYDNYQTIYSSYLGRSLSVGEKTVLSNALKIMMWKIYGKTFREICQRRYAYVSKLNERRRTKKNGNDDDNVTVGFVMGYMELPNRKLGNIPMYPLDMPARDVDYDEIICDTYDYLDKLIGFRLSDVFCAAFDKYYQKTHDKRAKIMQNYVRYGTDNSKEIWLLRYGLTFEDIEVIEPYVESVDEERILFKDSIYSLDEDSRKCILRYLP